MICAGARARRGASSFSSYLCFSFLNAVLYLGFAGFHSETPNARYSKLTLGIASRGRANPSFSLFHVDAISSSSFLILLFVFHPLAPTSNALLHFSSPSAPFLLRCFFSKILFLEIPPN